MGDFDNFNDSSSDSSFDDEWRDFLNDSDSGTDSLNGNNDLDNFFEGSSQPQNNDTMSSFEQWGSENINNGFANQDGNSMNMQGSPNGQQIPQGGFVNANQQQMQNGFQNNQQQVQNGFINNQQQMQNGFINQSQQANTNNIDDYWGNQQNFVNPEQQNNQNNLTNNLARNGFNMSSKQVGWMLFGVGVIIIILVIFISRIHLKSSSSDASSGLSGTEIAQESSSATDRTVSENSQTSQPVSDGTVLTEIPTSVTYNMSNDILEAQGTITGFKRFLSGNQIIYCIYAKMSTDVGDINISYYCNYQSYKSVNNGDSVTVKYQIADSNYISVLEMSN